MTFYVDPAFFILLAIAAIPAIVLGVRERPMRRYGFAVSVVFLVLLFSRTLEGLAAFGFFLVWATALTFWVQRLFKEENAHAVQMYRIALALAILPLAIYKVGAVFDQNLLGFLGISYITFKSVQVLIEIRDGLIENMSLFQYLYFLIFFPVFTSGPIMRSRDFCADIDVAPKRDEYLDGLSHGALWFLQGAVYKFVLAAFFIWLEWFAPQAIGTVSAGATALGELAIALCYGLYLFFDFAGYSLMAMGAGSVLGIKVPRNFRAPFRSLTIKDFWNRWHITLSFWLRDFVFMRFTRAALKRKWFKSRLTPACLGFMINMTLMGAWHGLTLDYLCYGIYHGLLLAGCELYEKKSKFHKAHKNQKGYKFVSWALTMVLVFFGFSLFSGQISRLMGL